MNAARHWLPILAFLMICSAVQAQRLKYYATQAGARVVRAGDTLFTPWSEGFLNPEFSEIDLNGDGVQDLAVFEPFDGRMLTFLYAGYGQYYYAPEYARGFPTMEAFALLRDYNGDGKADIFTLSKEPGGIDIYENSSSGAQVSFRLVKKKLLYKGQNGTDVNVYVPSSDVPAITDLDGDGDMDILAFDVFQSKVQYYKNLSVEKYGNADSLEYTLSTESWGKFELSPFDNSIILGLKKKLHGGSSLLVTDLDGDGDKDVLIGDVGYANLLKIENGRIQSGKPAWPRDTMIAVDSFWPSAGERAEVPYFPAGYEVDVDHDGLKDIIVTPHQEDGSELVNMVYYYHNEGTKAKPVYHLRSRNWLLDGIVDYGLHMAPSLVDLNGDGLEDLVMAVQGNTGPYYGYDRLVLYLNKGSRDRPVFVETDTGFADFTSLKLTYARPCFGDLDGDGYADMLLGDAKGGLAWYHNEGTVDGRLKMKWMTSDYQGIKTSAYSAPFLADMDGDSLPDLLLGKGDGTIAYYHNTGNAKLPVFTLVTDTLARIRVNKHFYRYTLDQDGQIADSTLEKENLGTAAPVVADFDGNGRPDILTGSLHGGLKLYPDVMDHISDSIVPVSLLWYSKYTTMKDSINPGTLLIPAVADMNGDSIPDILVGNYRGGGCIFLSKPDPLGVTPTKMENRLILYPNPATGIIRIEMPEGWPPNLTVSIYDAMGRSYMTGHSTEIDISALPAGVYFLTIRNGVGHEARGWFVKR
jgi:hypothetical protein